MLVAFWTIVFFAGGCTGSSPRFTSRSTSPSPTIVPADSASAIPTTENADVPIAVPVAEINPSLDYTTMLETIRQLVGTPHSSTIRSAQSLDCSEFTRRVYASVSIMLPRSTKEQFFIGNEVEEDSVKFGDLVFFNTTGESPSHVGIYLGERLFAHTSTSSGVVISSLEEEYYRSRYVSCKRVVEQ